MRLPCIRSCEKTAIMGIYNFRFFPLLKAHPAPLQCAYTGDWLCEENGKWHVFNNDTYQKRHADKTGEQG